MTTLDPAWPPLRREAEIQARRSFSRTVATALDLGLFVDAPPFPQDLVLFVEANLRDLEEAGARDHWVRWGIDREGGALAWRWHTLRDDPTALRDALLALEPDNA